VSLCYAGARINELKKALEKLTNKEVKPMAEKRTPAFSKPLTVKNSSWYAWVSFYVSAYYNFSCFYPHFDA
jgi:hypothetical protein